MQVEQARFGPGRVGEAASSEGGVSTLRLDERRSAAGEAPGEGRGRVKRYASSGVGNLPGRNGFRLDRIERR